MLLCHELGLNKFVISNVCLPTFPGTVRRAINKTDRLKYLNLQLYTEAYESRQELGGRLLRALIGPIDIASQVLWLWKRHDGNFQS